MTKKTLQNLALCGIIIASAAVSLLSCSGSKSSGTEADKAAQALNDKCPKNIGNGLVLKSVTYDEASRQIEVKSVVNGDADYVPRDEVNAVKEKFMSKHQWEAFKEADVTVKYVYLNKYNDIITTITISPAEM